MNIDMIKQFLKNPKNFVIINITRDYFFCLLQKGKLNNDYFIPYEIKREFLLNKTHIDIVFKKLNEIIQSITNNLLVIIVFQECFFSEKKTLKNEEFNCILEFCEKLTLNFKNCLLFVNLIHNIRLDNFKINEKNINIYLNPIGSKIGNKTFWRVSTKSNLLFEDSKNYIRNCTYVYMKGTQLYYHKKSSYFNEILNLQNYDIGFFEIDEINENLNEEEKEIAELLVDNFDIHICFDFQIDFENTIKILIKEKDNNFYFNNEYKNEVNELINFYNSLNIKKKTNKKFCIIQSNYLELNSNEKFANDTIVIKSDPIQQIVFKSKKSKEVKDLILNIKNLSQVYINNCKYELNNYMMEGIQQSKEDKINEIYKLNFMKEIELFNSKEISVPLIFDNFELKAKFNIYNINND